MNKRIRELAIQSGLIASYGSDHEGLRDFDYRKFAELVRVDEREACANVCEDLIGTRAMARHCADAIRARGDASDISQERVDETVKDRHELAGTIPISNGGIATSTPTDFFAPPKREWVGLTDHELQVLDFNDPERGKLARAVEAKLKEKNIKNTLKPQAPIKESFHKEWVGLTDEEVADYWVEAFNENGLYVQTFASIIEAKLKEKNA